MNIQKGQRGKRLTPIEVQQITVLRRQKLGINAIAERLGRHRETIGKRVWELEEGHGVEALFRESLKEAQVAHWRSLKQAAMALRDKFGVTDHPLAIRKDCDEVLKEQRDPRYLVQALREEHARDHKLWQLLKVWAGHVEALRRAYYAAGTWVFAHLSPLPQWEDLERRVKPEILQDWFRGIQGLLPPTEVQVAEITGSRYGLLRGGTTLAVGTEGEMREAKRLWTDVLEQLSKGEYVGVAKREINELRRLERDVNEQVDRLSLIEGFPGECEFCPLRASRNNTRTKRRRTT